MKRRIVVAIVTVAGLVVLAFGIPLAMVIDRQFEGQTVLRLERAAILAARDIPAGWRPGDPLVIDPPSHDTSLGVYDAHAIRVSGEGPEIGDQAVHTALANGIGESEGDESYVIGVPVTQGGAVVAVVRAEQRLEVTDRRIRAAWASMGLLAFLVVGASTLLARRLARRIAVPVEALGINAGLLGTDTSTIALPRSGMAEIDDVAAALEDAAMRVAESVDRERAFSAEVSHQLRTPITGLRLLIDTEKLAPRDDPTLILRDAAVVIGRLEATVDELLSLARNRPTDRVALDPNGVLADVEQRWRPVFARSGRAMRVVPQRADDIVVVASRSALGHILDVLVDNALHHGAGAVTISCEPVDGGVALRVADEGQLGETSPESLFTAPTYSRSDRGVVARRGIGLGLARRLAQAEGGELACTSVGPTTFSVLLAHI
ncbi:MAG: HAMP domain-containing sensor histidine kinase [Acidimicrobiales bacterium]